MTIYYLMIKSHNITGLKYLCQTKKKDPYSYKGSGKYWKLHLKQHGNNIHTEILKECVSKEELKEWGLYYSNLWNIVDSNNWANLKPETGEGGPLYGARNGMFGKKRDKKLMAKAWEAASKITKGKTLEEIYGEDKGKALREGRRQSTLSAIRKDPDWATRLVINANSPEAIAKKSGKNHCRYDHTVYTWTNIISGEILRCTRYEFIKQTGQFSSAVTQLITGKIKQSRGWIVGRT